MSQSASGDTASYSLSQELRTVRRTTTAGWSGSWVAERLGLSLGTTYSAFGLELTDLVGLAVRCNPRRAQLLVSTVLGKHVPTDPRLVYGSGALLGLLVADALDGPTLQLRRYQDEQLGENLRDALNGDVGARRALLAGLTRVDEASGDTPPGTVVLGFAETATALGHIVADVLCAPYLHSTRRKVPGVAAVGTFEEEHSHATSHQLLPADPSFFATRGPLVLVDDELSTGQTALNTIMALHSLAPRVQYVIAALVDLRSTADVQRMATVAATLGVDIVVVALSSGTIRLPSDILDVGQSLVAAREAADRIRRDNQIDRDSAWAAHSEPAFGSRVAVAWPRELREGARHGFTPEDKHLLACSMTAAASGLAGSFAGAEILVLGYEELMYAPLLLALALVDQVPAEARVRFSTTTRSPILAVDDSGYAVRTKLTFPACDDPDDGPRDRFAYNVAAGADLSRRFSDIVLVIDTPGDTPALHRPAGLLSVLREVCERVHLVVVPSHLPTAPEAAAGGQR
jgi:Phosphoribosyl transferase/TRSP domain C terminus to PRTase_2